MRKRDIRCKVERGRVIIPNVQQCVDPVPKLETDTLQICQGEIEALENLNIVYTEPTMIKDSEIFATWRNINNIKEANELYRKISIDLSSVLANNRILVYRFSDASENYMRATGMTESTERDVSC